MSPSTQKPRSAKPKWTANPENAKNMAFFLEGYERLVFLVDAYLLEDTPLKTRHSLNKEYIRFQPRVAGLYNKMTKEDDCPIVLERYCPPPEDLIMNDLFFTESGGFEKMDAAYGEIKWRFEGMGIAITHSPTDFQDHLKEIDRVLNGTMKDPQYEEPLPRGTIMKGKHRFTLQTLPRTDWIYVSIRFTGDKSVVMTSRVPVYDRRVTEGKPNSFKTETKGFSFEDMACRDDRNGRPDDTWEFFLELGYGNGRTAARSKEWREKTVKQKQRLTDILRNIFDNDTDPFETEREGVYHAKFSIEYPPLEAPKVVDSRFADVEEVFREMSAPDSEETRHELNQHNKIGGGEE